MLLLSVHEAGRDPARGANEAVRSHRLTGARAENGQALCPSRGRSWL